MPPRPSSFGSAALAAPSELGSESESREAESASSRLLAELQASDSSLGSESDSRGAQSASSRLLAELRASASSAYPAPATSRNRPFVDLPAAESRAESASSRILAELRASVASAYPADATGRSRPSVDHHQQPQPWTTTSLHGPPPPAAAAAASRAESASSRILAELRASVDSAYPADTTGNSRPSADPSTSASVSHTPSSANTHSGSYNTNSSASGTHSGVYKAHSFASNTHSGAYTAHSSASKTQPGAYKSHFSPSQTHSGSSYSTQPLSSTMHTAAPHTHAAASSASRQDETTHGPVDFMSPGSRTSTAIDSSPGNVSDLDALLARVRRNMNLGESGDTGLYSDHMPGWIAGSNMSGGSNDEDAGSVMSWREALHEVGLGSSDVGGGGEGSQGSAA
eukprot:gene22281-29357_t